MRNGILTMVLMIGAVVLGGCTHVEIPFPGLQSGADGHGVFQSGTVDVSGVKEGVTSERIVVPRIPFPAGEYARLKRMGNGVVKGNIAIVLNGQRLAGRQTRLYLNPVTSYSNQWYRESYLGGHKMGKSDPRLYNYLKFTASDNRGRFAFYGVPSGNYYVVGTVTCNDCGGKKIRIAKKIHVSDGKTVTVDLSKQIDG